MRINEVRKINLDSLERVEIKGAVYYVKPIKLSGVLDRERSRVYAISNVNNDIGIGFEVNSMEKERILDEYMPRGVIDKLFIGDHGSDLLRK